jgi:hypothetical protein
MQDLDDRSASHDRMFAMQIPTLVRMTNTTAFESDVVIPTIISKQDSGS